MEVSRSGGMIGACADFNERMFLVEKGERGISLSLGIKCNFGLFGGLSLRARGSGQFQANLR